MFGFEKKSFPEGRVQHEKGDYLRKQAGEAQTLGIKEDQESSEVPELFMKGDHEGERD